MDKNCKDEHRYDALFKDLPLDQGSDGRHRCCGCAYDMGYQEGMKRQLELNIDFSVLPYNQAGTGRHKSLHAAFALGYAEG